ncbi:unnamed protein product [Rhodiola kirilowii]
MDPEQTFIRVQERFSQMLTPRVRATLEYLYLCVAIVLFCVLVVMHANYVQQPGCSSELLEAGSVQAQLVQIKITSDGLWSQDDYNSTVVESPEGETLAGILTVSTSDVEVNSYAANYLLNWIRSNVRRSKIASKLLKTDGEHHENVADGTVSSECRRSAAESIGNKDAEYFSSGFPMTARESIKAAIRHFFTKWFRRLSFLWRIVRYILKGFQKLWSVAGIQLHFDVPKLLRLLHLDKLSNSAVRWLVAQSRSFEPTYLYTAEKGYLLLSEEARSKHNIRTVNVNISAWHSCLGNRWQQLVINRLVGYDTILMNSLLNSPGHGYLFNFQTKEIYNLSYVHELPEGPMRFGDYLVIKCGVLMMSLFVFFTTTMSVSFTLRETQTRMLKFTVQLQHHARHRLPVFQLIFVHVIESLVFVPIMIGILFFLFEFYDDQLLAFMVLILVWLCELFTLISVRTPISMKFFPRFFLLYFLVFHIYFFSYAYGFSYLALSTTAAFMQHLILYFWNRFEVPALQRFMQNRRSQLQQPPDFHITSSTILASTLHITRLNNNRSPEPVNRNQAAETALRPNPGLDALPNNTTEAISLQDQNNQDNLMGPPGPGPNPPNMNSFSSMLLWVLGGASTESLNSLFSMFREVNAQDRGQAYAQHPQQENTAAQSAQL